jgi:hypothetical protein
MADGKDSSSTVGLDRLIEPRCDATCHLLIAFAFGEWNGDVLRALSLDLPETPSRQSPIVTFASSRVAHYEQCSVRERNSRSPKRSLKIRPTNSGEFVVLMAHAERARLFFTRR